MNTKNNYRKRIARTKQKLFLDLFRKTLDVKHAAMAAGYKSASVVFELRKKDPEFNAKWEEAVVEVSNALEAEAFRRATEGELDPVYHKGEVVGYRVQKSDALLQFLLKGLAPERYRDRVDVQNTTTVNVGVALLPPTAQNAEDWENQSVLVHDDQRKVAGIEEHPMIDVTPTPNKSEVSRA